MFVETRCSPLKAQRILPPQNGGHGRKAGAAGLVPSCFALCVPSGMDEVFFSYLTSVLEGLGCPESAEEDFDMETFVEMMEAYIPGFADIGRYVSKGAPTWCWTPHCSPATTSRPSMSFFCARECPTVRGAHICQRGEGLSLPLKQPKLILC